MSEQTKQVLLPTYWRKDIAGAWRMNVEMDLVDSDNMTGEGNDSDSSMIEEKSDTSLDFGTDVSESESNIIWD